MVLNHTQLVNVCTSHGVPLYVVFICSQTAEIEWPFTIVQQNIFSTINYEVHVKRAPRQYSLRTFRAKKQRLDNCLGASSFA